MFSDKPHTGHYCLYNCSYIWNKWSKNEIKCKPFVTSAIQQNMEEKEQSIALQKHHLFDTLYSNYFMIVVAEQIAVRKAWSGWCPNHLDQWYWEQIHGSTCRRLCRVQCCCQCNDGLQSWQAWHSTQSHFSWGKRNRDLLKMWRTAWLWCCQCPHPPIKILDADSIKSQNFGSSVQRWGS